MAADLISGACTFGGAPEPPTAAAAAGDFLAAWESGDATAMAGAFDRSTRRRWPPARLRRSMARTVAGGEVTAAALERTGSLEEPSPDELEGSAAPVEVDAGFSVTYASQAVGSSAPLRGTLELSYNRAADRWEVAWDESLLLPGLEGAVRLGVAHRQARRAPILDRGGRVLAKGTGRGRRYPFGTLAGITLGHLEPLSRRAVARGAPGEAGDLVGASGLEGAYDERLGGSPSTALVAEDRRGRPVEVLGRKPGEPGRRLETTLDLRVQRAAQQAYGSTLGGAVVLDPKSGDILAALEGASFDPNDYVGAAGVEPFNRALAGLYPPGSSMKVVTASAALDTGVVSPSSKVTGPDEYKGVRNFESGVFGTIDFATAVRESVNTAFAQVAEDLGPKRITRYAEAYGFNRPPEAIPTAAASSFPFPEEPYDLLWGAIGQARVLATPLEMASVAATVANEGRRMEPRLVRGRPQRGRRVLSPKTARTMTRLMESVVEGGTGTAAQIAGVRVAGKTGTAEVNVDGGIKNHAWFVCFAPAGKPKVAVAVVAELGGIGGEVAAPLARAILERALPLIR